MRAMVAGVVLASLMLVAGVQAPVPHAVAITIDDLPRGGDGGPHDLAGIRAMTTKLVKPFRDAHVPVTAFVNAGLSTQIGERGLREILDLWLDAGADLGNHSATHLNINQVPLDVYTADILNGEPTLRAALASRGKTLRYYRHPFLYTGPTPAIKHDLQTFLDQHAYRVAPVTIDDSDYIYAALYTRPAYRDRVRREYVSYMASVAAFFEARGPEVVGHEFPQVLLIHASQLNADLLPDLLSMFRRRGYAFVSLDEALADPAYASAEAYAGTGGFSWIHRWSRTKGLPGKGEPDPPAWVLQAFNAPGR